MERVRTLVLQWSDKEAINKSAQITPIYTKSRDEKEKSNF